MMWFDSFRFLFCLLRAGECGDAVIVCGSSVEQVKANVDACADDTPLPQVRGRYSIIGVTLHYRHTGVCDSVYRNRGIRTGTGVARKG